MTRGGAKDVRKPEPAPGHDDSELIRSCIAGDQRAWTMLVKRHERLVYSVPRRLGLPADLIDDVFQETFVVLLRQLPSLQHHRALPQWLITTARRIAIRMAQRQRRSVKIEANDTSMSAPEFLERFDRVERVNEALEELERPCRELLVALTRAESATYAQIAEQLHMPIGSIGPRRARCLARLLQILQSRSEED